MKKLFKLVDILLMNIAFWGSIAIPFFFADSFWNGVLKIIFLWIACYAVLFIFAALRAAFEKETGF
jgi:Zn-dependent protease with chaperone function